MNLSLTWKQTATDEVAAIWLGADSATRQRITAATSKVDQLLRSNPYENSESREADRRIMFVAPLAVTFSVNAAAGTVEVLRVRQYR